jgi:16S rRNA (guanine527-N7)-methyltransferase
VKDNEFERLWQNQLDQGLLEMGLELDTPQKEKLQRYLALLNKWNSAYNLTAVRDPKEMVPRQLLDALSILRLINGKRVLDVGTGPGLPGIPLAIALPQVEFTLLDSNGKKTRFVQQAKMELDLENVSVVQSRIEQFSPPNRFDTITSRAFSSLQKFVDQTLPLLVDTGLLVAMKGSLPKDEIKLMEEQGLTTNSEKLLVPMSRAQRHAVLISRPVSCCR